MKGEKTKMTGTLDYPVEIRAIPAELGGGYSACIPSLGRWAFFADGETPEEALEHLDEVKTALFEDMIERGKEIPAPPPLPEEVAEEYSGRLLLRLPKDLHREVAEMAEANGSSLNQYIATALAKHVGRDPHSGFGIWQTLLAQGQRVRPILSWHVADPGMHAEELPESRLLGGTMALSLMTRRQTTVAGAD